MNQELIELIKQANSVLIVLGKGAKRDSFAAALALYLSLIQEGKMARVCTEAPQKIAEGLAGSDKISPALDLGGNVLKISFACKEDAVNQVSYNTTEDRFNILVEPRQGGQPIDAKQVQFSYTGGAVDAIIAIDTPSLEQLGSLYLENPDIFVREKIVNIDRRFDNKQYGAFNIVEKGASSTSELVMQLLLVLRIQMSPEIATNLYAGLVSATNMFTSFSTNAQSFDAAAQLLKTGARKATTAPPVMGGGIRMPTNRFAPPSSRMMSSPFMDEDMFMDNEQSTPIAPPAQSSPVSQQQPPTDWLKPKLYKSSDAIKQ
ncbi:hypothetical protein COU89_01885 [Candidatus Roizmanbacteria bacterium CG10_big_fil_rev_8_21_14_0_10_45_7]|uniref:DDH domain-containing protein n=1 Tax=Candidatus Roizmanbacteria bacterium CG10_big_fil_rev_8_21_14_0_10_45_7 TaxID=1974854 RepID=A0A2M8KUZ4_9BACT|nr:MAG: hypothetical protein COU89_01885 [Candidatus Roizmanbacteria bacterium CG10_big_fil_rev_8_21_14_0_10_45_7]